MYMYMYMLLSGVIYVRQDYCTFSASMRINVYIYIYVITIYISFVNTCDG